MIEAISLKNKTKKTDVVNLTSPTEDETNDNNNDFLFLKDKNDSKEDEKKKRKTNKYTKKRNMEIIWRKRTKMEHEQSYIETEGRNQNSHGIKLKVQNIRLRFYRLGGMSSGLD